MHTGPRLSNLLGKLPFPLWLSIIFIGVSTLTRLTLLTLHFGEVAPAWYWIPVSLLMGVVFDLYVALYVTLPATLFMLLTPTRWRASRFLRAPAYLLTWLYTFGLLYLGVTEYFFFDEFNSRLNYIAVDYLIYPHEVFVNLWDTYPVLTALIATASLALLFTWLTRLILRRSLTQPQSRRGRTGYLVGYVATIALGLLGLNIDSSRISDNRALNEITGNGVYSFFYAARTNEMDYNQYYARVDQSRAVHRLRHILDDSQTTFLSADTCCPIDRHIDSDRPGRRFNIVLVLEESFGSKFIGKLEPEGRNLTPEFDRLADEHGLLFTHIYATGNRTVRGIEATLASFPPIPGRSIVKRPGNAGVFTLSSLLKDKGYNTVFVYGGLSYFDNIGSFASHNGYDRVYDETDFEDPIFKTIWGVCDEDLFGKSLSIFDSLQARGAPFFATLLTVSNHTPYTYPPGRIPFDPNDHKRDHAVRYADYSIGKFIDDAASHSFFDSTLFVFVADHGARVYGSDQIPLGSYEIPVLFYNRPMNPSGSTCDVLGSQMDLAPTILDYLGFDYNSEFFGRSLFAPPADDRPVLISHNRDVALMNQHTIAVLGIQGNTDVWDLDSTTHRFERLDDNTTVDTALIDDAIAYYMTAYNMYRDHRLHPLDQARP